MRQVLRRRRNRVVAILVLVPLLVILGFGIYLGSLAGALPWQAEPTRIPITPFAGIPGFDAPTPVPATPTPAASSGLGVVTWTIAA